MVAAVLIKRNGGFGQCDGAGWYLMLVAEVLSVLYAANATLFVRGKDRQRRKKREFAEQFENYELSPELQEYNRLKKGKYKAEDKPAPNPGPSSSRHDDQEIEEISR